jgi:hypothetical protein
MVELVEEAGRENSQLEFGNWYGQSIPEVVSEHLDQLLERERKDSPSGTSPSGEDDLPF